MSRSCTACRHRSSTSPAPASRRQRRPGGLPALPHAAGRSRATASSACTTTRVRTARCATRWPRFGPGDAVQLHVIVPGPGPRGGIRTSPTAWTSTFLRPAIRPGHSAASRRGPSRDAVSAGVGTPDPGLACDLTQRRRDVKRRAVRNGVGRLVAQSPRLAELYAALGVSSERMVTMPFTLAHIPGLRPRPAGGARRPHVRDAAGRRALRSSWRRCGRSRAAGLEGRFRLRAHGWVDWVIREELAGSTASGSWASHDRQRARHAPGRGRRRPDAVGVGGVARLRRAGWLPKLLA